MIAVSPVHLNQHSKVPINLPPTNSPDGTYKEQPILDYDAEEPTTMARSKLDFFDEKFLDEDQVYALPNVRRRRQNENEEARLLSQSAFNRITETLGALNKVGSFFLNMTREVNGEHGHRGDMQLISSSSSVNSVSTKKPSTTQQIGVFSTDYSTTTEQIGSSAILTLSNNVLGQNVTKPTEPLIKRVGQQPEKESKLDKQTLNEKIDMAALAEKKRKKHQAVTSKKDSVAVSTTLSPGNCIGN